MSFSNISKKNEKNNKNTELKKPRFSISKTEVDALKTMVNSSMSNWHYEVCDHWKKCTKDIRAPKIPKERPICFCEEFKSSYPNTDIVIRIVLKLLKKLEVLLNERKFR